MSLSMVEPAQAETNSRLFEPPALGWQSFAWSGGRFDTAFRPRTGRVEGSISLHHPTIITIVKGGCDSVEVRSECGHRYVGPDFAGSVSFIPPDCTRQIKMTEVESEWASLSIRPDFLCLGEEPDAPSRVPDVGTFTNRDDGFLHSLLIELRRLHLANGQLDGLYCETMAVSAAQYVMRRYAAAKPAGRPAGRALPGWRLQRVADYVDARLADPDLRLDEVARAVGLSTGFFHRAFKETTGETPLAYIQRRRIECAMRLLAGRDRSILDVALAVGFLSPSHFTRLFRRRVGMTPSEYRNGRH